MLNPLRQLFEPGYSGTLESKLLSAVSHGSGSARRLQQLHFSEWYHQTTSLRKQHRWAIVTHAGHYIVQAPTMVDSGKKLAGTLDNGFHTLSDEPNQVC